MKKFAIAAAAIIFAGLTISNAVTAANGNVRNFDDLALNITTIQDRVSDPVLVDKRDHSAWKPTRQHIRTEQMLAGVMLGECRGQSEQCMRTIGHVAMNRARSGLHDRYGKGLYGVLTKRKAFSCLNRNDPNRKIIMTAFKGKLDPDTALGKKWQMAQKVANELMHNGGEDPTVGSTHYHAPYVTPRWIKDRGMEYTTRADGHIFYKFDA